MYWASAMFAMAKVAASRLSQPNPRRGVPGYVCIVLDDGGDECREVAIDAPADENPDQRRRETAGRCRELGESRVAGTAKGPLADAEHGVVGRAALGDLRVQERVAAARLDVRMRRRSRQRARGRAPRVLPMLKYCEVNGEKLIVRVAMMFVKRLSNHVNSSRAREPAKRCSIPASNETASSGSSSGFPRKKGDRLNDCSAVGSLIPRPAATFSLVSPSLSPARLAMTASDPRGAAERPKLSLSSRRTPIVANTRGHDAWC